MILLFVTLLVFWFLLNGALTMDIVVLGVFVALVIAYLFRGSLAVVSELRLSPRVLFVSLLYVIYFLIALVKSNLQLASIVLSPALPVKPGFVKVRTRLKSHVGRLVLANSITLTPGTLTVDLDGEWLYVHWVSVAATDVESATTEIVSGFERYLEVMYG